MRRLACLLLALVLAGCAGLGQRQAAPAVADVPAVGRAILGHPGTIQRERQRIPPAALALLLAPDTGADAVQAPMPPITLCAVQLPADPRWLSIGRYDWLRNDFARALAWCLAKFHDEISVSTDGDRRLVLQDACGLTSSVPEHPPPAHGNGLRWLDVCYPTLGASNWTQGGAVVPPVPMVSIWDGDRPARLDCRRLFLWWELLARVFPGIGIETDKRIADAVTRWARDHGVEAPRLAAVMGRVSADDLATSSKYGHYGHMHLDFGDRVDWGAMAN